MKSHTATRSRRSVRGAAWIAIASALAIGLLASSSGGSIVSAVTATTSLHQTPPIASTDPNFQGTADECAGLNLGAGQVFWHFVLTQTSSGTAGSFLHATFTTGEFDNVLAYKKAGGVLHWSITTSGGSLTGAHTNRAGRWLNLSHICQGPPTTTTTSSSSTTTTTSTQTTTSTETTVTTQTSTSTDAT